jgi:hypothetical protein
MRFYDKINPPLTNIRKRELRREMQSRIGKTDDFFKWANTYFVPKPNNYTSEFAPSENGYFNCYIVRANAYSSFTETLSAKQRSDCRQNNFKDHVISWCKYYGYKFNPQEKLTDIKNSRILKRVNDKVEECFYIAVSESNSAALPAQVYESDDYTLINSSDIPF